MYGNLWSMYCVRYSISPFTRGPCTFLENELASFHLCVSDSLVRVHINAHFYHIIRFIFGNVIGFGIWVSTGNHGKSLICSGDGMIFDFESIGGNRFFSRDYFRSISKSNVSENGANKFKLGCPLILKWTCSFGEIFAVFWVISSRRLGGSIFSWCFWDNMCVTLSDMPRALSRIYGFWIMGDVGYIYVRVVSLLSHWNGPIGWINESSWEHPNT